ncbi:hypothetical protein HP439_06300 [Sphingobacterium shayense]|uniref:hypothetical protein n=1 Tax=Sphingobacterium shayense TaxID=626343 RepID=UPI0015516ACB|nr:hypothetical protein [Sphingobacterium shayense]NQD70329.1 hypothetical protein [Sphingobacterium shayense]
MSTAQLIEIKIVIPSFVFNDIQNNPKSILEIMGHQQLEHLKSSLVNSLSETEGGPEIVDLNIAKFEYNKELYKGCFRVNFRISRRYCCSDITAANNDYVDFEFEYRDQVMIAQGNFFQWTLDN